MKKIKLIMTLPINSAETLQSLIDGAIGSSTDYHFTKQMTRVLKRLDKEVKRYYEEQNISIVKGVIKSKQTIYI